MKTLIASLLVLVGCASSPLVGTWDGPSTTTLGTTSHAEVVLDGNGTLTYALVGSGSCNGTLLYSGYTWASDAVTLTFSGTPTCSGMVTCGALSFGCGQSTLSSALGACTYVLSNGNQTLTTTGCTNGNLNASWSRAD